MIVPATENSIQQFRDHLSYPQRIARVAPNPGILRIPFLITYTVRFVFGRKGSFYLDSGRELETVTDSAGKNIARQGVKGSPLMLEMLRPALLAGMTLGNDSRSKPSA